jgi:heat shock protein HtpX
MFLLILLFTYVGFFIGGEAGMIFALMFASIGNIIAYWYSDKLILKIYSAKSVSEIDYPELTKIVFDLCSTTHLPRPAIYIVEEDTPNAFATGRNPDNAAIAVTRGLLKILDKNELKGVLAHELAHIKNRDILISTISAVFAAAITSIAYMAIFFGQRGVGRTAHPVFSLLIVFFAPLAASVIQMAVSRSREFEADRVGGIISENPAALASALNKIEKNAINGSFKKLENHPETAQMMIISSLSKKGFSNLFSTHPSTEERILRLKKLEHELNSK